MIRVVVRHVVHESEGALLGDFPPSEIPALLELLESHQTRIYDSSLENNLRLVEDTPPLQLIKVGRSGSPRYVLEILLDD